jgi:hypothetical protein
MLPHRMFGLRLKNASVAGLWFNTLDYFDHAAKRRLLERRQKNRRGPACFFP